MCMDVNSHVWSALNNLAASGECCNPVKPVVNICLQFVVHARITFAPGAIRFICLRFSIQFSGIVGMTAGYGLCVYIYTAIVRFL